MGNMVAGKLVHRLPHTLVGMEEVVEEQQLGNSMMGKWASKQ